MITEHEIEYHIDTQQMLKFLERHASLHTWSVRLGVSKSALYYYRRGERKIKNKGIYEAILTEYYRIRSRERTKRIYKLYRKKEVQA